MNEDSIILVQFSITTINREIVRNISTIESLTKENYFYIPDRFKAFWELISDEYLHLFKEPMMLLSYNIVPENKI